MSQSPSLFNTQPPPAPLAHQLRPQTVKEFVGQEHLLGSGQILEQLLKGDSLPSLIFWGPPGCGKTTLAHLIAQEKNYTFVPMSAITSGVKEIKEAGESAKERFTLYNKKTLIFLDEIHRFNKAQQDSLLPPVEAGIFTLIGATTENPSFAIIAPLLSRIRLLILKGLTEENLKEILIHALRTLKKDLSFSPEAQDMLLSSAEGDARRLLTTLEIILLLETSSPKREIQTETILKALQKKILLHDRQGDEHYNLISAFIKSIRDSDPDAGLYYLARMLEAGEDPLFIARRLMILSSEDIGNANPQALPLAVATMQTVDFIGMPEGWIPLAQCVTYLAGSPKSNASYTAYKEAKEDVKKYGALPIPLHILNAPTKLMKEWGYGKGYQYAHDAPDHIVEQQHLPDAIKDKKYYLPQEMGEEVKLMEWLQKNKK